MILRSRRRLPGFRDLPLAWKLTVPSAVVIILAGGLGGWLVARDFANRAQTGLNERLLEASLSTRGTLHAKAASVGEAATLGSNLEGMAQAVERRDGPSAQRLLESVVAIKPEVSVVAVVSADGRLVASLVRSPGEATASASRVDAFPPGWVERALAGSQRRMAFTRLAERPVLAMLEPICARQPCVPDSYLIAGRSADGLVREAGRSLRSVDRRGALAIFDVRGDLVARFGSTPALPAGYRVGDSVTTVGDVSGDRLGTLFAPFSAEGRQIGTAAVSLPAAATASSLRDTGLRLSLILLAVLLGIVLVGMLVSRLVLAQVRLLLRSSRSLGRGDLAARAPVLGDDELGELAEHFNDMAAQLEASHGTLERRVAQRTEEVRRLLKQRTEFFASISHELRTPLAIIINRSKLLLDERSRRSYRLDRTSLQNVRDSAEGLLRVVNEILDLSRAESGKLEVSLGPVDLPAVIAQVRSSLEPIVATRGIDISVDIDADLRLATGDTRRITDVVINLVENAIKYTPTDGAIVISARRRSRWIEVSVKDNGVGVPPEVGERIFQPFYRVPGSKPQHGEPASGLGLALAKRLVEAQGGRISYKSALGAGSEFTVKLRPYSSNGKALSRRSASRSSAGRR